jgi:hypothetical protein
METRAAETRQVRQQNPADTTRSVWVFLTNSRGFLGFACVAQALHKRSLIFTAVIAIGRRDKKAPHNQLPLDD